MNLPLINYLTILNDVVVRVLRGSQARVVGENSHSIADFESLKGFLLSGVNFAVLL